MFHLFKRKKNKEVAAAVAPKSVAPEPVKKVAAPEAAAKPQAKVKKVVKLAPTAGTAKPAGPDTAGPTVNIPVTAFAAEIDASVKGPAWNDEQAKTMTVALPATEIREKLQQGRVVYSTLELSKVMPEAWLLAGKEDVHLGLPQVVSAVPADWMRAAGHMSEAAAKTKDMKPLFKERRPGAKRPALVVAPKAPAAAPAVARPVASPAKPVLKVSSRPVAPVAEKAPAPIAPNIQVAAGTVENKPKSKKEIRHESRKAKKAQRGKKSAHVEAPKPVKKVIPVDKAKVEKPDTAPTPIAAKPAAKPVDKVAATSVAAKPAAKPVAKVAATPAAAKPVAKAATPVAAKPKVDSTPKSSVVKPETASASAKVAAVPTSAPAAAAPKKVAPKAPVVGENEAAVPVWAVISKLKENQRGPEWSAAEKPEGSIVVHKDDIASQLREGRVQLPYTTLASQLPTGWVSAEDQDVLDIDLATLVQSVPPQWMMLNQGSSEMVDLVNKSKPLFAAKRKVKLDKSGGEISSEALGAKKAAAEKPAAKVEEVKPAVAAAKPIAASKPAKSKTEVPKVAAKPAGKSKAEVPKVPAKPAGKSADKPVAAKSSGKSPATKPAAATSSGKSAAAKPKSLKVDKKVDKKPAAVHKPATAAVAKAAVPKEIPQAKKPEVAKKTAKAGKAEEKPKISISIPGKKKQVQLPTAKKKAVVLPQSGGKPKVASVAPAKPVAAVKGVVAPAAPAAVVVKPAAPVLKAAPVLRAAGAGNVVGPAGRKPLILKAKSNWDGVERDVGASAQAIDINEASETVLMLLPSIGLSMAQAIIKYRETYGGFKSIFELLYVGGINEAQFKAITGLDPNSRQNRHERMTRLLNLPVAQRPKLQEIIDCIIRVLGAHHCLVVGMDGIILAKSQGISSAMADQYAAQTPKSFGRTTSGLAKVLMVPVRTMVVPAEDRTFILATMPAFYMIIEADKQIDLRKFMERYELILDELEWLLSVRAIVSA